MRVMRELLDKINEIEVKAEEFRDENDVFNMTYCMGQLNILMWLLKNSQQNFSYEENPYPSFYRIRSEDIDLIHAGFKEKEEE